MKLSLATPQELLFEGEVSAVRAPGILGYFQILNNHAPLLTILQKGTVTLSTPTETLEYSITGGILEIIRGEILLLVDGLSLQE